MNRTFNLLTWDSDALSIMLTLCYIKSLSFLWINRRLFQGKSSTNFLDYFYWSTGNKNIYSMKWHIFKSLWNLKQTLLFDDRISPTYCRSCQIFSEWYNTLLSSWRFEAATFITMDVVVPMRLSFQDFW